MNVVSMLWFLAVGAGAVSRLSDLKLTSVRHLKVSYRLTFSFANLAIEKYFFKLNYKQELSH